LPKIRKLKNGTSGMKRNGAGSQNHFWRADKLKEKLSILASLQVLFLPFLFAQGALCEAKEAPSVEVPASLLSVGDYVPGYAILVDKSEQRLYLYQQETDGLKLIKTFVCATGENSGIKKIGGTSGRQRECIFSPG
jgi:murein L,D-transpeptidase YafK